MTMRFISLSYIDGSYLLRSYTSIRYQVCSEARCFISMSYIGGSCVLLSYTSIWYQVFLKPYPSYHCFILVSLAFFSHIQVLGIFKCHLLHIIVIYQSVELVFCSQVQVLGIRYFQRPCVSYHCCISVGLVFAVIYKYQVLGIFKAMRFIIISLLYICGSCLLLSYTSIRYYVFSKPYASYNCCISVGLAFCYHIQVLDIRYFQMPCASYHCHLSFALMYKYQVLGIFKCHVLYIIVLYWLVFSFALIYKYQVLGIFKSMRFIWLLQITHLS